MDGKDNWYIRFCYNISIPRKLRCKRINWARTFSALFTFDRAIVKYTTFIVQPFPNFKVDYSQWHNVLTISQPNYEESVNMVGFVYKNIEYGKMFFDYIRSWNFDEFDDKERNIILSIVEEVNGAFTFYIYANPYRKNLNKMFKAVASENFSKNDKVGKIQDGLFMQMAYWHAINYTVDTHMRNFLKYQPTNKKFAFAPFEKNEDKYETDLDSRIILYGYKYSKRQDLHKYSTENQLTNMTKNWK